MILHRFGVDLLDITSDICEFTKILWFDEPKYLRNNTKRKILLFYFVQLVMKRTFMALPWYGEPQQRCVKSFSEGDLGEFATDAHTVNLTRLPIHKYYSRGHRL